MPNMMVRILLMAYYVGCSGYVDHIDGGLTNSAEQQIVGQRSIYIGAAAFRDAGNACSPCTVACPCVGTATWWRPSGSIWVLTSTRSLVAPLALPAGTVIHNLTSRVNQSDANSSSGLIFEGTWSVGTIDGNRPVLGLTTPTTGVWATTPAIADPSFALKDGNLYELVFHASTGTTWFNGMMVTVSDP